MKSKVKVHLYKVNYQPGSQPLEDVLTLANASQLGSRIRLCGQQDIRLDEAIPPTQNRPYWLLDFGNIRFSSGPGRASRQTPTQSFNLQKGEGFAEETAALYDANSNAILIQYNRHYHKPINFIFIDTRHKQADYSIINTVYRYAPILRLDVGRMIDNKHMTDLEAVSNYRG